MALGFGCGEVQTPPDGQFSVVVDPGRVLVRQGEAAFVDVTVTRDENFLDPITITLADAPDGVTAMPLTIAADQTTGSLTLTAAATAVQGASDILVTGTGGRDSSNAALRLLVGGEPGTLDQSFGTEGKFTPPLNGMSLASRGLAITEQGIVVTGFVVSSPPQAITVRVLEDGTLDPAFGSGGFVSTGLGGLAEGIAIAGLPDGSVVVAGIAGGGGGECEFGVFRYDVAGALDTSFGASGVATFDAGTGCAELHNIVIAPDGNLLVSGTLFSAAGGSVTRGLRFSPLGVRDASFDITEAEVVAEGSAVLPDGKLLLSGIFRSDFWVARYQADGTRDTSFGMGGIATTDLSMSADAAHGVVPLADNKVLAVGVTTPAGAANKVVSAARYNANGSLDVTFGAAGKFVSTTPFDTRSPTALAVSGTQTLFVGVRNARPAVVRINETGTVDGTFGDSGVVEIDFGIAGTTNATGGFGIAVDPDGRIVISGDVGPAGAQRMAIARLWP
jgi:uncharacterized delta-60 repeat protein